VRAWIDNEQKQRNIIFLFPCKGLQQTWAWRQNLTPSSSSFNEHIKIQCRQALNASIPWNPYVLHVGKRLDKGFTPVKGWIQDSASIQMMLKAIS
jgi:hypothetical protein